jgi:hypothetical protein
MTRHLRDVDVDDVLENSARLDVLDVQSPDAPVLVIRNRRDTKVIVTMNASEEVTSLRAEPAGGPAYRIDLLPDVPFLVLLDLLEIL